MLTTAPFADHRFYGSDFIVPILLFPDASSSRNTPAISRDPSSPLQSTAQLPTTFSNVDEITHPHRNQRAKGAPESSLEESQHITPLEAAHASELEVGGRTAGNVVTAQVGVALKARHTPQSQSREDFRTPATL